MQNFKLWRNSKPASDSIERIEYLQVHREKKLSMVARYWLNPIIEYISGRYWIPNQDISVNQPLSVMDTTTN